jgi:alpha-tubulin suppressor-like RCC1 family protein
MERGAVYFTSDRVLFKQVAAGETATAALSDEGEVYTWGWGGSWWDGTEKLGFI